MGRLCQMKHYIITKDEINHVEKIAVNDLDQAKKFVTNVKGKSFTHKGRKVEVLGLFNEEEAKAVELFHHTGPSHYEKWKQNMQYLKNHKEWPNNR